MNTNEHEETGKNHRGTEGTEVDDDGNSEELGISAFRILDLRI